MGTSKSYEGIKGNPNWSKLSDNVTRSCESGEIPCSSLNNIISSFVILLGGSQNGGRGKSLIGGKAGIKTAKKLGSFLSVVKENGLKSAFSNIGFEFADGNKASDAINSLLEYCAGVAISHDECAAKEAERLLLDEIAGEALTFYDLENNFHETIEKYSIEELLIRYYAYYIYEHLSIDFYEKLVIEKGTDNTKNLYTQLKRYLIEKVETISLRRNLSNIVWASNDGDTLMKNIFEDTLKAFENYEG